MKAKPKTYSKEFFVEKGRTGGKSKSPLKVKAAQKNIETARSFRKLIVKSIEGGEVKFGSEPTEDGAKLVVEDNPNK